VPAKITGKQCRQARSLLKWNLHDLASRVKSILARRIDSFEHGTVHLQPWENEALATAFKKAGILLKADLEVALAKDTSSEPEERPLNLMHGEGGRIVLSTDEVMLPGDPQKTGPAEQPARDEAQKRPEGKK